MNRHITKLIPVIIACCSFQPAIAHAYVGPGTGLSAIGSFLALIGAVFFAVVGFLWFPIKRIFRKLKKNKDVESEAKVDD